MTLSKIKALLNCSARRHALAGRRQAPVAALPDDPVRSAAGRPTGFRWWGAAALAGAVWACAAPAQTRTSDDATGGVNLPDVGSQTLAQTQDQAQAQDSLAESDTPPSDHLPPVAAATPPCRAEVSAPRWWHGALGYEIFVRSFADSDGDGIGDIPGIIAHFDYLNDGKPGGDDLGVDLIWLMPIFPSPSYHGYDVADYMGVNPQYGTLADLDALVALAHSRGVKLILDWVPNHGSKSHPFFAESAAGTGHSEWFVWRDTPPEAVWKQPWSGSGKVWHSSGNRWYYGVFSSSMPDWNLANPQVTAAMQDSAGFWLDRGIDGLRLDAVRYVLESGPGAGQQDTAATLSWWEAFASFAKARKAEAILVGEVWASNAIAAKYQKAGLAMTFDFDLQASLLSAVEGGIADGLKTVSCQQDGLFGQGAARGTFLSNHDMVRWTSQVPDVPGQKMAEALLFFLPGTPFLYYGEELGALNGPGSDDKDKRLPMRWTDAPGGGFSTGAPWVPLVAGPSVAGQLENPTSLLRWVQRLAQVRKDLPALQQGALGFLDAPEGWLLAVRTLGKTRILGVFHLDDQSEAAVPPLTGLGPASSAQDALDGQAITVQAGVPVLGPLGPRGVRWIIVN